MEISKESLPSNMHLRTQRKQVKFLEFQTNPLKKPKKVAEDSIMIQSKQSMLSSSPNFDDDSILPEGEERTVEVIEDFPIPFDEQSMVESRISTTRRKKFVVKLENEPEIQDNLQVLKDEYDSNFNNLIFL